MKEDIKPFAVFGLIVVSMAIAIPTILSGIKGKIAPSQQSTTQSVSRGEKYQTAQGIISVFSTYDMTIVNPRTGETHRFVDRLDEQKAMGCTETIEAAVVSAWNRRRWVGVQYKDQPPNSDGSFEPGCAYTLRHQAPWEYEAVRKIASGQEP